MYVGLFVVVIIQHPEKHLKLRAKQYSVYFCAECSLDMHPGLGHDVFKLTLQIVFQKFTVF